MLMRTGGLLLFVIISACAGQRKQVQPDDLRNSEKTPKLFVGHSQEGKVVVAATHGDAMSGLAVTDTDLGLASGKGNSQDMRCVREMVTGTHVPTWICRYKAEEDEARLQMLNELSQPRVNAARPTAAATLTVGSGSGSRGAPLP